MSGSRVIVIGTSAGGVSALQKLLAGLPKLFRLPIVIVQHLPHDADFNLNLVFGRYFSGQPLEAADKMPLEGGHAYFAPPGYHLLIERNRTLALTQDEPVNFARPSIDVLFESAAWALGPDACGVLLTGANSDGALGLQKIKSAGGFTIVQDPRDAEAPYMPKSALDLFAPDLILDLVGISNRIAGFSSEPDVLSSPASDPAPVSSPDAEKAAR